MSPPLVLHVDDDDALREVLAVVLEKVAGFEVESAEGGAAALEAARRRVPDLVLLDVMMPGMDGPETLRRLRELPGMEEVPIVFLTAKVLPEDLCALDGLGAAAILQKPFRAAALVDSLRRVLGQD